MPYTTNAERTALAQIIDTALEQQFLTVPGTPAPVLSAPAASQGILNIGAGEKLVRGAFNIDPESKFPGVFKGSAQDLSGVADRSQSMVIMENPYGYNSLTTEVSRVLQPGGFLVVRGAYGSREFQKFLNREESYLSKKGLTTISRHWLSAKDADTIDVNRGNKTSGGRTTGAIREMILIKTQQRR